MGILKKPYELSVWEDRLNNDEITESKVAVIGSDSMESPFKALTPKLKRSINGSNELTFKLHKRIIDTITGEEIDNPFVELVDNEVKLKLKYNDEWYDFLVKNSVQSTDKSTYTYTATDLHVNELSKTGYGVELDTELMNNMGTAKELLDQVLKDAPGWKVGDCDDLTQTQEDLIVEVDGYWYPYSDFVSKPKYLRRCSPSKAKLEKDGIYDCSDAVRVLKVKEDGSISEFNKEDYKANGGFYVPSEYKTNTPSFVMEEDGHKSRGRFATWSNKTEYDPLLKKVVTEYRGPMQSGGNAYYGYSDTNYVSSSVIEDLVSNYEFTSTSGWKGAININKKDEVPDKAKAPIIRASAFVKNTPGTSFIDNVKNNSEFETATYQRCLEITIPKYTKTIDSNSKGSDGELDWNSDKAVKEEFSTVGAPIVVNSGFYDNRSTIGNLVNGKTYLLDMEWAAGYGPDAVTVTVGTKTYNLETNSYYQRGDAQNTKDNDRTFITFSNSADVIVTSGEKTEALYSGTVELPPDASGIIYTEEEYQALKTQIFIKFDEVSLESDEPYKTENLVIDGTPKVRGYFGPTLKLTKFRIYEKIEGERDETENGVTTSVSTIVTPDSQVVKSAPVITHYFFTKENRDNYYDVIGQNAQVKKIRYSAILSDGDPELNSYTPVVTKDKIKSITASKSNYFNIIQQICETFECWAVFKIEHDKDGKIMSKKVLLKKEIGESNPDATISYDTNLKKTQRTIDSKQIVSRLIVPNNSNEYADTGFCSITKSQHNPTGENDIFNFSYYLKKGMIKEEDLDNQLYGNGDGGYYIDMRALNDEYDEYNDAYQKCATPFLKALSNKTQAEVQIDASKKKYEEECSKFESSTGVSPLALGAESKSEAAKKIISQLEYNSSYREMLMNMSTYFNAWKAAESDLEKANKVYDDYKGRITKFSEEMTRIATEKAERTKKFMTLMGRFIQEGTWKDDSYMDDDKYYIDALQTGYNSCMPQVSYTFDIIDVSQAANVPAGNFSMKLGDTVNVTDTEMFGNAPEPITLTEIAYDLDDPSKNSFKFQNYRNQFADLFQRTAATVQQVQYASGDWAKAAGFAMDTSSDQAKFLQNALNDAELELANAGEQSVVWDTNGITVTDLKTPSKQIRIVGGALLLRDEDGDGLGWKAGLTSSGLSAKLITSGQLNTGVVQIMNGEEPYFRWDYNGITAYYFDTARLGDGTTKDYGLNPNKGVRFDRFGLYGYDLDTTTQNPEGGSTEYGLTWHPTSISEAQQRSMFALTWDGMFMRLGGGSYRYGRIISEKDGEYTNSTELIGSDPVAHQGQAWIGTPYVGMPDYKETKKEIYNAWLPSKDEYGDCRGMPYYDTSEAAKSNPTFVPVFTVNSNGQDNLIIYDDGTVVARKIKLTDAIEFIGDISPRKDVYGQKDAKFVIKQEGAGGSTYNSLLITGISLSDIPGKGVKYKDTYEEEEMLDSYHVVMVPDLDENGNKQYNANGELVQKETWPAYHFPNSAWSYSKDYTESEVKEFNTSEASRETGDKRFRRRIRLDPGVSITNTDIEGTTTTPDLDSFTTWHKDFDTKNDVYYCHTDDFGATWQGPFLINGRSIVGTEIQYFESAERYNLGWFDEEAKDNDEEVIEDGQTNADTINWITEKNLSDLKLKEGTWLYMRVRDKYQDGTTGTWRYLVSYIAQGSVNYAITLTPDSIRNSITSENGYNTDKVRATFTRSFGTSLVIPLADDDNTTISIYMDGNQEANKLGSVQKDENGVLVKRGQFVEDNVYKDSNKTELKERAVVLHIDKDSSNIGEDTKAIAPQNYLNFVVRMKQADGSELVIASKTLNVDIATVGHEIMVDTEALVRSVNQTVSFSPKQSTVSLKTVCRNLDVQLPICKEQEDGSFTISDEYRWEVYGYESTVDEFCDDSASDDKILRAGPDANSIIIDWEQVIKILDPQNNSEQEVDSREISHVGIRVYAGDNVLTEKKIIVQNNPLIYSLDVINDYASIPVVEGTDLDVSNATVKKWGEVVELEMRAGDEVINIEEGWTIEVKPSFDKVYSISTPTYDDDTRRVKFDIKLNKDLSKLPSSASGDYPIVFTVKRTENATTTYQGRFIGSKVKAPADVIGYKIKGVPSCIVCHVNNENSYSPKKITPTLWKKTYKNNDLSEIQVSDDVQWYYQDLNNNLKELTGGTFTTDSLNGQSSGTILIAAKNKAGSIYDQEEINIAADGVDGKSIEGIVEYYFAYNEDTSVGLSKEETNNGCFYSVFVNDQKVEGTYWCDSIRDTGYGADKPYLYNFEEIQYTNETETTKPDLIAHWGQDGQDIKDIIELYATNQSQSSPPSCEEKKDFTYADEKFTLTSSTWKENCPLDEEINEGDFVWEVDIFIYTKKQGEKFYRITTPRLVIGKAYNPYQLSLSNDKDFVVTGSDGKTDSDDFGHTKTTVKVLKGGAYLSKEELTDWYVMADEDKVNCETDKTKLITVDGISWYPIDENGREFRVTGFNNEADEGKLIFNAAKFKTTKNENGENEYEPILYATSTSYNIAKVKAGADGMDGMNFSSVCSHDYIGRNKKGEYKASKIQFTPQILDGKNNCTNLLADNANANVIVRIWIDRYSIDDGNGLASGAQNPAILAFVKKDNITKNTESGYDADCVKKSVDGTISINLNSTTGLGTVQSNVRPQVDIKFDVLYDFGDDSSYQLVETQTLEVREDAQDALYYYFDVNQDYFKYETDSIASNLNIWPKVQEGNGTVEIINIAGTNYQNYSAYYKIENSYKKLSKSSENNAYYTIDKSTLVSAASKGGITLKLYNKVFADNNEPTDTTDALATRTIPIYSDGASVTQIDEWYYAHDSETNEPEKTPSESDDNGWTKNKTPGDFGFKNPWLWNIEQTTLSNGTVLWSKPAMLNGYKTAGIVAQSNLYRITEIEDEVFNLTDALSKYSEEFNGDTWKDLKYCSKDENNQIKKDRLFNDSGCIDSTILNKFLEVHKKDFGVDDAENYWQTVYPIGDVDPGQQIREYNIWTYEDGKYDDLGESVVYTQPVTEYRIVLSKDNEIILVGQDGSSDNNDFANAFTNIEFLAKGKNQDLSKVVIDNENKCVTTATIDSLKWTFTATVSTNINGEFQTNEDKTSLSFKLTGMGANANSGSVTFTAESEDGKKAFSAVYSVSKRTVTSGADGKTMWMDVTPSSISIKKNGGYSSNTITACIKTCQWGNASSIETEKNIVYEIVIGKNTQRITTSKEWEWEGQKLEGSLDDGTLTISNIENEKITQDIIIKAYQSSIDTENKNFLTSHTVDVVSDGSDGDKGDKGDKGDTGEKGENGYTRYEETQYFIGRLALGGTYFNNFDQKKIASSSDPVNTGIVVATKGGWCGWDDLDVYTNNFLYFSANLNTVNFEWSNTLNKENFINISNYYEGQTEVSFSSQSQKYPGNANGQLWRRTHTWYEDSEGKTKSESFSPATNIVINTGNYSTTIVPPEWKVETEFYEYACSTDWGGSSLKDEDWVKSEEDLSLTAENKYLWKRRVLLGTKYLNEAWTKSLTGKEVIGKAEVVGVYNNSSSVVSSEDYLTYLRLTKGGDIKGIIKDESSGNLYFNADFINTGVLRVGDENKEAFSAVLADIKDGSGNILSKKGQVNLAGWRVEPNTIYKFLGNEATEEATKASTTIGKNGSFLMSSTGEKAEFLGCEKETQWALTIGPHFGVTNGGALYASSGKIGNWIIEDGYLHSNNWNTVLTNSWRKGDVTIAGHEADDWRILLGGTNINKENNDKKTAVFGVDVDGALYASAGKIGGMDIKDNAIFTKFTEKTAGSVLYLSGAYNGYTANNAHLTGNKWTDDAETLTFAYYNLGTSSPEALKDGIYGSRSYITTGGAIGGEEFRVIKHYSSSFVGNTLRFMIVVNEDNHQSSSIPKEAIEFRVKVPSDATEGSECPITAYYRNLSAGSGGSGSSTDNLKNNVGNAYEALAG